jgi:hypothetical protein
VSVSTTSSGVMYTSQASWGGGDVAAVGLRSN